MLLKKRDFLQKLFYNRFMKKYFDEHQLKAIENLGCSREAYQRYLERFRADYSDSSMVLSELITSNQLDEARIHAHSVKGLAATLGLSSLSELAAHIEMLLHNILNFPCLENSYLHSLKIVLEDYKNQINSI